MAWELTERFDTPEGTVHWARMGSGPPLVFLHGTPFSSEIWHTLATRYAQSHTVYLWDMLGYGRSDRHEGQDMSLPAQQAAFTGLLRHWGLHAPSVVGHDFGGAVALRAAVLDGVAYDRLALVDAVSIRPWGTGFFRLMHDNPEVFAALPGYLHRALIRAHIASASHRGLPDDRLDRLLAPWTGPAGQAAYCRNAAQNDDRFTGEIEDRYGEIDCPVLVAWGRQDQWLAGSQAERLVKRFPRARLAWIEEAGHLVQEDAPEQLAELLDGFLAKG